jgi:hypothetical protein
VHYKDNGTKEQVVEYWIQEPKMGRERNENRKSLTVGRKEPEASWRPQ